MDELYNDGYYFQHDNFSSSHDVWKLDEKAPFLHGEFSNI